MFGGVVIFLSVLAGLITLLGATAEVLNYLDVPLFARPEPEPEPNPLPDEDPPVPINPALQGVIEIGPAELWAAAVDPTQDIPWPLSSQAMRGDTLGSAVAEGVLSPEALTKATALTRWLTARRGVEDTHISWYVASGVQLDRTKAIPPPAQGYYQPVEPEERVRRMVSWLSPKEPQVAVARLAQAQIEIGGLALATRTTREDIKVEEFPGIAQFVEQLTGGADADTFCRELASALRKAERGTPTRTGCPLYLVGRPVERLIAADAEFSFSSSGLRELAYPAQVNKLIENAQHRFEAATPEEQQARAAEYIVAKLLDWIGGKALQSTRIYVVDQGWILQYVRKPGED